MFEDSLIESGNRFKTKRLSTTILSFTLQVLLVGVLILIPLIYTDALPKTQLMTFLVAPPPPPPPPPPPAAALRTVAPILNAGRMDELHLRLNEIRQMIGRIGPSFAARTADDEHFHGRSQFVTPTPGLRSRRLAPRGTRPHTAQAGRAA